MSLLFDTSPLEDTGKRRKKKAAPGVAAPPVMASLPPIASPAAHRSILGRLDEDIACMDESCGGGCHDITASERGQWLLECLFCGTGQWIPAFDNRLDAQDAAGPVEFVWPEDGSRFAGKPLAEIDQRVLAWAAKHEANEGIRAACETWIASHGGSL